MALILAIESDTKQAALLKCVVRNYVGAGLLVVHSKDEAIAAIDAGVPDLMLLSALLSPRDEEEVVAHLRTLDHADHLQTLTIPWIAASHEDEAPRGLLAAFRPRRPAKAPVGCDPRQFADEIVQYLQRAEEIKAERAAIEEAARVTSARMLAAECTENTDTLAAEVAEVTEETLGSTAEMAESAETVITGASHAATSRRQAPLAMWAKAEAADTAPAVPVDQTIGDEIRALLRSLRIPSHLADVGSSHGCRIRRIRLGGPTPARRRALIVTRAIAEAG